ncbi:GntR family transcriptional regulator [Nocardioides sp. 616]|uniref:GntR family transcriptional regulator n=1 Tax=Nocardioides sp. 616 TaxID=2268090 RepID=UPI000CE38BBF|nr:GntR family transcriptional regulator [Nocardioides sp. 616]
MSAPLVTGFELAPTVDDLHRVLLDRVLAGAYPAGSKLPSCRALAEELGSNSSTVDRAIGRLAAGGRVRTVPRRGTFVLEHTEAPVDAAQVVTGHLEELLQRARRLGVSAAELRQLVERSLDRVDAMPRIAVVECNERDLRKVTEAVQQASNVEVQPVLLCEIGDRVLDEEFDAVAVPIFHLNDVAGAVRDLDRVLDLNLVAAPSALRRLIALRDLDRLVVVAPHPRGVDWMKSLVGQYFPGQIDGLATDVEDPALLVGEPVVVVNNAAGIPAEVEQGIAQLISIEWELDARFAAELQGRIDGTLDRKKARP